jgi:hypothetical protein
MEDEGRTQALVELSFNKMENAALTNARHET